jgi:DNA-binding NtrC family response regulator
LAAKINGGKGVSMVPSKFFAFFVCDASGSSDSPKVVLQGSSVEAWSGQVCEEMAQLFDSKPRFAVTDMVLPGGICVEYLVPVEKAPTTGVFLGTESEGNSRMTAPEYVAGDFILPPFELQALAHVLKRAANNSQDRHDIQPVKEAI